MVARTKEGRLRYASTMGNKKKRPYTFDTLKTFRLGLVRQIASEWWGIDHAGLSQNTLIDLIVEIQGESE